MGAEDRAVLCMKMLALRHSPLSEDAQLQRVI